MHNTSIPKLFLLIALFPLAIYSLSAQKTITQAILFDEPALLQNTGYHSDTLSVAFHAEELPFIGISAYCLDRSVKADLYYRTRAEKGWTDWVAFRPFIEGRLPDRVAWEGPPITAEIYAVQFRSDRRLTEPVVFRLYFPSPAKKKRTITGVQEKVLEQDCNCERSAYCDRDCWCPGGRCPPDRTPVSTTPTHIIIHHSAGFNSSSNFAAVVAYYWDLHVNTNGWDDIGYNWLIDAEGTIYEGRGDGRLGAHFSCMNGNTAGICLIGNFEVLQPSTAAITRLREWLAWESCSRGIDLTTSSAHASSQLNLRHVSGHRDGNSSPAPNSCAVGTVCPGGRLYEQLDAIAAESAAYACLHAAPDLVIRDMWTDPAEPRAGDTTDLYVSFRNVGAAPASGIRWEYRIDGQTVGSDTLSYLAPDEIRTRMLQNYIFTIDGTAQYCIYADTVDGEPNGANNSFCLNLTVSGATDLTEAALVDRFRVYPNPSDGRVTVEVTFREPPGDCVLQVINTLGQLYFEEKTAAFDKELKRSIDLHLAPPGHYFLRCISDRAILIKPLALRKMN